MCLLLKLFFVFVALGLSILILLIIMVLDPYLWRLRFLVYVNLNFPLRLSNVIIPPSLFMSAVGRAYIYLNFPLRLSNVIIPPSLLMSAVARASLSCRSSVAHPSSVAESLPRTAYYFLFSFFSSLIMSENHLDACRLVDAYFRLNLEW